jgi:hypothetical protein
VRRVSPDFSRPLGWKLSNPFQTKQIRIFSGLQFKSHVEHNGLPGGKGWAVQTLRAIAALRVHFSRSQRKMQLSVVISFLIVATLARADWKNISSETEPSRAKSLEHRYLVFENSDTGERVSMELALFSAKSYALRVIDQPAEPRLDLAQVMQREKCLAGVNGGYFDPSYAPIGLLIVDGKTIAPLERARLLSGVLSASAGKIQISRFGEFSLKPKIDAAVECGPMIVDLGESVRGLESTRPARRTFVAIATGNRAALGFCSDVTLADLSKILATDFATNFKIQRALNLDGGSSSAFWFKRQDGSAFSVPEEKTVRDFIGIVTK